MPTLAYTPRRLSGGAASSSSRLPSEGNPDAEYSVGVMYTNGRGLPQSYVEAAKWFHRAAEKGQAGAQYDLGVLYAKGQGVPENFAEAAKWFRKAADQGKASAQYNLAYPVHRRVKAWRRISPRPRSGIARRRSRATWIRKTAWPRCTASGDGVQQDFAEAAKWYRKAADQGDIDAQNELGSLYGNGQGVPQDYVEAYRWFDLAASRNAGADFETHDNAVRIATSSPAR